ncbi:hypothetical protein LINGRAHAP2_LOCUS13530 [Linum grandiflorum]
MLLEESPTAPDPLSLANVNMCAVRENRVIRRFKSDPDTHGMKLENIPGCREALLFQHFFIEVPPGHCHRMEVEVLPNVTILQSASPQQWRSAQSSASHHGRITPFPEFTKSTNHVSEVANLRPSLQPKQHQPQLCFASAFLGMSSTGYPNLWHPFLKTVLLSPSSTSILV